MKRICIQEHGRDVTVADQIGRDWEPTDRAHFGDIYNPYNFDIPEGPSACVRFDSFHYKDVTSQCALPYNWVLA